MKSFPMKNFPMKSLYPELLNKVVEIPDWLRFQTYSLKNYCPIMRERDYIARCSMKYETTK